jgi:manganese/zinc/iron transport system substrate-binding protein
MSRWIAFVGGFALALAGCESTDHHTPGGRLQVVTTTSIVADLVQEIGGANVHVTPIMPPGIDPHRYMPLPSDSVRLSQADLVFFNGLHLEGKMVDLLERATISGRSPVAVAKAIPKGELRMADGEADPHVWFDVSLWSRCIDPVRDALIEADPPHAADYRANADRYREKLAALHEEVRQSVAAIPADRRIIVTSHDAFGYFAAAYGFEVHGLQGISTAGEVGLEDRRVLADLLVRKSVPAVFAETSVPTKGLLAVLDTVKSRTGKTVKLIGGSDALYSDSLGPKGSNGETYIGMVRHNASIIVGSLAP